MREYFPEPKSFGGREKNQLDGPNYAKNVDLNNGTGVDTSKFAQKVDLASLKSDVDKLVIDKLKNALTNFSNLKSKVDKLDVDKLLPVPVDLSKLSDVVKMMLLKKDVYNVKIKNIEDKIPDITNFAANTTLNEKINEVKREIPSITNLATTAALTVVENKIPKLSNLVKNTDYNTKICETENKITTDHDHDKHVTTQESNKLTAENFTTRLARLNINDIANYLKKTDFDNKLNNLNKNFTLKKNKFKKLSKKD